MSLDFYADSFWHGGSANREMRPGFGREGVEVTVAVYSKKEPVINFVCEA